MTRLSTDNRSCSVAHVLLSDSWVTEWSPTVSDADLLDPAKLTNLDANAYRQKKQTRN